MQITKKVKKELTLLVDWLDHHRLVPVVIAGVLVSLCLITVFGSWLIGYYANALLGMHFELASCWQGITIGVSGIGGVAGSAYTIWKMYDTDSRFNSKAGETRNYSEKPQIKTDNSNMQY